jgi:hypothetical protein
MNADDCLPTTDALEIIKHFDRLGTWICGRTPHLHFPQRVTPLSGSLPGIHFHVSCANGQRDSVRTTLSIVVEIHSSPRWFVIGGLNLKHACVRSIPPKYDACNQLNWTEVYVYLLLVCVGGRPSCAAIAVEGHASGPVCRVVCWWGERRLALSQINAWGSSNQEFIVILHGYRALL